MSEEGTTADTTSSEEYKRWAATRHLRFQLLEMSHSYLKESGESYTIDDIKTKAGELNQFIEST